MRDDCCINEGPESHGDCDSSEWPKGPAFNDIMHFGGDEDAWLDTFSIAWKIAIENGHYDLHAPLGTPDEPTSYECHKISQNWRVCN